MKDFIKRMGITLNERKFDGSDPILIIDFLVRFVKEANVHKLSEAQAFVTLPYFLNGMAREEFESASNLPSAEEAGVN